MKIVSRPVPRWPRIPLGIMGFAGLWALVVIVTQVFKHYTGADLDTCLFHRLTGYSCPTCGTTRGLLALARGAWRESLAWNPMTMTGAVIGSMAVLSRVLTARTVEFQFTPREKRALIIAGLVLLGVNWAWLIYSHP
jgi:hypothetical protein